MRLRLLAAALTLTALALTASTAHATLVYSKLSKSLRSSSVYIADDDGQNARRLVKGANRPRISPDGQTLAYVSHPYTRSPEVRVVPIAGGAPKQVVDRWAFGILNWSPDGTHLVANAGGIRGKQRLKLIDVATGTANTLARGFFTNASFSPDGSQIVFDLTQDQDGFPDADLYIASVTNGLAQPVTSDGHSQFPLWGPTRIAYSRWARGRRKHDGPKYNLSLLDPATGTSTPLTNDTVPYLLFGLTPAAWSADGTELLAQFGGQDTVYPVTVDPATGQQRVVGKKSQGIIPYGISKDGSTILGVTSQPESPHGDIVVAPYTGGKASVIVKRAGEPDWTR